MTEILKRTLVMRGCSWQHSPLSARDN